MKKLTIKWQRVVENNTTCLRCSETEQELEKAYIKLRESLKLLNIEVIIEKNSLDRTEFSKNPLSSNQILINDRPLESWLAAETGKSQCCSVCGDEHCRTIIVGNNVYETIPENLIVMACLKAASELIPEKNNFIKIKIKEIS
ncbi:MAG: DUF2703 domain-containing protein [Thermodesulfovibrio sp.]|nr:DUF2703 domain-containing protein [Thermodesulfovibrio sp.]MDW7997853.1 DUF2703 domain-containing protein [Thermodesulfovibrio sp.]